MKRDYGPDGDPAILVAQAASRTLNPLLSEKVVEREYARDEAAAIRAYTSKSRDATRAKLGLAPLKDHE